MKWEILWEINKFQIPGEAILSGIAVCVIMLMIFLSFDAYKEEHKSEDLGIVIVLSVFFIVFATAYVVSFNNGGSTAAPYAKQYYSGNYKVEEGILEEHKMMNGNSYYTVNGIEFFTLVYEDLECGEDYIKIYYVQEDSDDIMYVVRIDKGVK